jgi:hypothetical protein
MFPQQQSTKGATEGRRDGKAGELSPQTRIHIRRVLYAGLARATEHDPPLLARNRASAFKKRLPKVERKELVTLTPEQSTLLLGEAATFPRVLARTTRAGDGDASRGNLYLAMAISGP